MKNKIKEIVAESVLKVLNEGLVNTSDAANIPSNVTGAEIQVGDVGLHDELTEEEKKSEWFKKLKKRVNHKM